MKCGYELAPRVLDALLVSPYFVCRMERRRLACSLLQGLGGQAFFLRAILQVDSKHKAWVYNMIVPYTVFFAVACGASLLAGIVKSRLIVHKWRSRVETGAKARRHSLGGVPIAPHLASHEAVVSLKDRLDERQLERYKYLCYLLAAVSQDIPMGTAHQATSVGSCPNAPA